MERVFSTIVVLSFFSVVFSTGLMAAAAVKAPVGSVVFQVVGRNQIVSVTGPTSGTAFAMGYVTAIDGITESLFLPADTVSVSTALFTFRTDVYSFLTIDNGNSKVRLGEGGDLFNVYYNNGGVGPNQDFKNPDSFSDGQLIATFRIGSKLATRVGDVATQVDSATLVSSKDFVFQGQTYNFKKMVPNGVTFFGMGPAITVLDPTNPENEGDPEASQFAFSASVSANGK
jgi:hypothetical protein